MLTGAAFRRTVAATSTRISDRVKMFSSPCFEQLATATYRLRYPFRLNGLNDRVGSGGGINREKLPRRVSFLALENAHLG